MMTFESKPLVLALMIVSLTAASACATPGKDTGIGAAAGGGTGAVLGGLAGGWKGAALGAGVGALAGGAIGNSMDKQANELKKVADTKRTDQGVLVNFKNDLLFDTGSATLKAEAPEQLGKVGDILAKYPEDRIRIEGFTDATGGSKFNQLLSQQRAQSVSNALIARGVKPQQMTIAGKGPAAPVASNTSAAGRSKNRRVELHIDVPPQQG